MWYIGSKRAHAKQIIPFMMAGHWDTKPYIEPFVGGGNMIQYVEAPIRLGSDIDADVIAVLDGLANGWNPPDTLSEEEYNAIRCAPSLFPPPLVGFAKFSFSYGGIGWGGFARNYKKSIHNPDHVQSRLLRQEALRLRGCQFSVKSYTEVDYPDGATVYMDPPYAATQGYESGGFDHTTFWYFCRNLAQRCRVFVSEYNAPADWVSLWEKPTLAIINSNNTNRAPRVEKLFVWKGANNI